MSKLYEFQINTINNVLEKFKGEKVVALCGEKDTGKSVLISQINNHLDTKDCIPVIGHPALRYKDFGCFDQDFIEKFNVNKNNKKYINSIIKDIVSSITSLSKINISNTLDSILPKNEKDEIYNLIAYTVKIAKSKPYYVLFDNVESYDSKTMFFLYNLTAYVMMKENINIKILIVLGNKNKLNDTILDAEFLDLLPIVEISRPTDNDLKNFSDPSMFDEIRNIPIKYLPDIKSGGTELSIYFSNKLDKLSSNLPFAKKVMYTLVLFDEEISFSNLCIILSDVSTSDIFQSIQTLKIHSFVQEQVIEKNAYYTATKYIRQIFQQKIPPYLSANRFELFVKQIERYSPLDYAIKYWLYYKSENYNNAYASAILCYCSIAREELKCTNDELLLLNQILILSPYRRLYIILKNGYRAFNENEYKKCYEMTTEFLSGSKENQKILFSIYIPEFIYELIFLRGMCIGRLSDCDKDIVSNHIKLLDCALDIVAIAVVNDELQLRLKEQKLLLETYLPLKVRAAQKNVYNQFIEICGLYQRYIRESSIGTSEKWEIRFAAFLSKANTISALPHRLRIMENSYDILNMYKDIVPKKYLRATCNLAGDYMWRGKFAESREILERAIKYIEKQGWFQWWGVIYQMYIFSSLYETDSPNPQALYDEYTQKVWECSDIRSKMHEQEICNSNYAILLSAVGKYEEASTLLQETLDSFQSEWQNYSRYLLLTNLSILRYILGDCAMATELAKQCDNLVENNLVPIFAQCFLEQRSKILNDIFKNKKQINNLLIPLSPRKTLASGYCSDNYFRPLLFSDINYWAD